MDVEQVVAVPAVRAGGAVQDGGGGLSEVVGADVTQAGLASAPGDDPQQRLVAQGL